MISTGVITEFEDLIELIGYMKAQQAAGAPFDIKTHKRFEALAKEPRWGPFYGYQHVEIPNFELKAGGGVSFTKHIGKPLTEALWEDLMLRLQIKYLQIYRPGDAIPCVATSTGQANVHLDENGDVRDIYFTPYWRK